MSMAPKDGNIIKDGIAELLGGLIGSTEDTGGSRTEGTVMAKENAILEKMVGLTVGNAELKELVLRNGNSVMGKFLTNPISTLSVSAAPNAGWITKNVIMEEDCWLSHFQSTDGTVVCKINGEQIFTITVSSTGTEYIINDYLTGWKAVSNAVFYNNSGSAVYNYPFLKAGTEVEITVTPREKTTSTLMYVRKEVPSLETMQARLDYLAMMVG